MAQNNFKNLNKLNVYNNLLLAANGEHGLYVHNRKFYWNSIENYFEPIYYDGEFNLEKKIKNLNFPLSLDYGQSINATIDLVNSLDKKKILQNINSKNLILSEKKLNKKITNLNENLLLIKKLFNEKSKVDLFYNLEGYKSKDLFNNYLENLKKQKIKFKFAVYDHLKNLNYSDIQICENSIESCDQNLPLDLSMTRDLIEGKLRIDGFDYQFSGFLNEDFHFLHSLLPPWGKDHRKPIFSNLSTLSFDSLPEL